MSDIRGRPIVVYNDDYGENSQSNAAPSLVLNSNRVKRLPGRDISISSSDEDNDADEDLSSMASRIEIIEDPKNSKLPRKSSLAVHATSLNLPRSASGSVNTSRLEKSKDTSKEELVNSETSSPLQARKRSVSFLSLAVEIENEGAAPETDDLKTSKDDEDEDAKNLLQVVSSARAIERRKSIESIVRPPTPPNVSHRIKD